MHLPSAVQCRAQLKQVDSLRSFTVDNSQSSVSALLPGDAKYRQIQQPHEKITRVLDS